MKNENNTNDNHKMSRRRFLKSSSVASAGALLSIYGLQTKSAQATYTTASGKVILCLGPPPYINVTTGGGGRGIPSFSWENAPYILAGIPVF